MRKSMKWKFKKNAEPQGSGDFWYDITDGGYIKPQDVLSDKVQLKKLQQAVELVKSFQYALTESELLNEI